MDDRLTPRIAINVDDYRSPDNDGNQPANERIAPDGPAAYFCTLPVKAMVASMCAQGVPAAVSNTAGTYLCNHVAYGVLHALHGKGRAIPAGFIHVPFLPEQVATKHDDHASMALDTMLCGMRAGLATIVEADAMAAGTVSVAAAPR